MSLGFNLNRRHRFVGLASGMPAFTPRSARQSVPKHKVAKREFRTDTAPPPSANAAPDRTCGTCDELHWCYGTVLVPVGDLQVGECICLVYPMKADKETGVVSMRYKTIHSVTGQIAYSWTDVYDPATDTRFVGKFSFLTPAPS